jgi:CO/xanthine dehydrogenase FAD-binding subunit
VAVLIDLDARGRISGAAIAVGACSAVPVRLTALERKLAGASAGDAIGQVAAADVQATLAPIDDVRGSAHYRRDAAAVLVRRALTRCLAPRIEAAA